MNKIAKICFGLGFAHLSHFQNTYVYQAYGIADATYVGLWVPSFFLVGDFFDRHVLLHEEKVTENSTKMVDFRLSVDYNEYRDGANE